MMIDYSCLYILIMIDVKLTLSDSCLYILIMIVGIFMHVNCELFEDVTSIS